VGLASHALWLELTSRLLGPSFVPLAPCLTYTTMALTLILIITQRLPPATRAAWPTRHQRRLLWRDRAAWGHFIRTTTASLLTLTEWLFWEVVCFRVGSLGKLPLATYTTGYTLEPCFFMLAIGLSTNISNAVGNGLGAGRVLHARRSCLTGLCVGGAVVLLYVALAWLARDGLIALFTRDAAVKASARHMWPDWCVFMLVSGAFALMLGVVKGLGLQKQLALLVLLLLWPVGAPLVWLASSPAHVWRMLALTYSMLSVAMGVLVACSDWHALSRRAVTLSSTTGAAEASTAGGVAGGGGTGGGLAAADSAVEAAELQRAVSFKG